jgi:response regulator of citrate/malate metabolism
MDRSLAYEDPGWGVLIVEDDPAVAYLHQRLLERVPGYHVTAIAGSGEAALDEIRRDRPDLILLDLSLRGMSGMTMLRKVRAAAVPVEVIAVTASDNVEVVRALVHLGVLDYLVKPFSQERLHQGLALFRHRMASLAVARLTQDEVDALAGSGRAARRWLPKGLTQPRLEEVRAALKKRGAMSAEEVASATGMARVTARRYLEYLVTTDQAKLTQDVTGPGRPRKRYAVRPKVTGEQAAGYLDAAMRLGRRLD